MDQHRSSVVYILLFGIIIAVHPHPQKGTQINREDLGSTELDQQEFQKTAKVRVVRGLPDDNNPYKHPSAGMMDLDKTIAQVQRVRKVLRDEIKRRADAGDPLMQQHLQRQGQQQSQDQSTRRSPGGNGSNSRRSK